MDAQEAFVQRVRVGIDIDLADQNCDMLQRQAAYSKAFEQLIEQYTMHRPVLAATKAAYVSCLDGLRQLRQADDLAHSKAREQGSQTANCFLYRRRNDELADAAKVLRRNNDVLRQRLTSLEKETNKVEERIAFLEDGGIEKDDEKFRIVDGMPQNVRLSKLKDRFTVEQLSDPVFLESTLAKLKNRIIELKESKNGEQRFVEKVEVERARVRLQDHLLHRDGLVEENYRLWHRLSRLRCVLHTLQEAKAKGIPLGDHTLAACSALAKSQQRKTAGDVTHFDVVNTVLQNAQLLVETSSSSSMKRQSTASLFSSDATANDQLSEATERILEYIDQFNLLMRRKEYYKAALHAASSPKGVLKNTATLRRFEDASRTVSVTGPGGSSECKATAESGGDESPAMLYVEAVLNDSFSEECERADISMAHFAAECVRAAIRYSRADLALAGISSGRVPHCEPVADALLEHAKEIRAAQETDNAEESNEDDVGSLVRDVSGFEKELLDVAFRMYSGRKVGADGKALECLIGSGRFEEAIDYALRFSLETELCNQALLGSRPDLELCVLLVMNRIVELDECIGAITSVGHPDRFRLALATAVVNAVVKSGNQSLKAGWISWVQLSGVSSETLQQLSTTRLFRETVLKNDSEFLYSFTAALIVQQSIRYACNKIAEDSQGTQTTRVQPNEATNFESSRVNWDLFRQLASVKLHN